MAEHILPIYEDKKINAIFVRANSALIKNHITEIASLDTNANKCIFLEELWKEEYRCDIEKINSSTVLTTEKWKSIVFPSKTDLTMFVLRWS
jgi:hypothetical protein